MTSTDYVPSLLESGRARAQAEGHRSSSRRRTPRSCPSPTPRSTSVISTFGVMFTPNQEQAAKRTRARLQARRPDRPRQLDAGELHRTTIQDDRQVRAARAGRQVAGAVGHEARGSRSCSAGPRERSASTQREFVFRYRSPTHWLEVFRTYYGPMNKTFGALDAEQAGRFHAGTCSLLEQTATARAMARWCCRASTSRWSWSASNALRLRRTLVERNAGRLGLYFCLGQLLNSGRTADGPRVCYRRKS